MAVANTVYKCTLNEIYKSTNGGATWTSITGTNPPGGTAENYVGLAKSGKYINFIARESVAGTWRSWMYEYDSVADTGAWHDIGTQSITTGPTSLVNTGTGFQLKDYGTADSSIFLESGFRDNRPQSQAVKLDASTVALVYGLHDDNQSLLSKDQKWVAIIDTAGGTSVSQDLFFTGDGDADNNFGDLNALSSTNNFFFVTYPYYGGSTWNEYRVKVASKNPVSGSVTFGDSLEFNAGDEFVNNFRGEAVHTGSFLGVFSLGEAGNNGVFARLARRRNETLAWDTARYTLYSASGRRGLGLGVHNYGGSTASALIMMNAQFATAISGINWFITQVDEASLNITGSGVLEMNADSFNEGNGGFRENTFVVPLSQDFGVVRWGAAGTAASPGSITSYHIQSATSVNFGEIRTAPEFGVEMTVMKKATASHVVLGRYDSLGGGARVMVLEAVPGSLNYIGGWIEASANLGGSDVDNLAGAVLSSERFVVIGEDQSVTWDSGVFSQVETMGTELGAGNVDSYAIGVDSDDANTYVTLTDNTNLSIVKFDVPAGASVGKATLGAGTVAQAQTNTRTAYPMTPLISEGSYLVVFGRMVNPAGLSSDPAHIISSTDGGESFNLYQVGWGADHCGAAEMVNSKSTLYSMRNLADSNRAALYANKTARSVLPFKVRHGAMLLNTGGYIIAGASNNAGGAQVALSKYPFLRWYDYTKNYPNAASSNDGIITGIAIL